MGGTSDMNVPILGGEQMYQALKSLGVPTELVVYPGQFHGFTRPSFIRDRYERWLAWWDKYLKTPAPAAAQPNKQAGVGKMNTGSRGQGEGISFNLAACGISILRMRFGASWLVWPRPSGATCRPAQ